MCLLKKKQFNQNVVLVKHDRIGKDLKYKLSGKKISRNFNFEFRYDLEAGLKLVDDWIIKNKSFLLKQKTIYVHKK